ncbi:MAG: hypothetical protein LBT09_10855, partial [Planctomycetaceae bacterium]|nr:hypothetical protein [Planctomycetaceae bacterium]
IWIAVCVYLLIAILKKRFDLPLTLKEILHILSITIFEKMPFFQAFLPKNTQALLLYKITNYYHSTYIWTLVV